MERRKRGKSKEFRSDEKIQEKVKVYQAEDNEKMKISRKKSEVKRNTGTSEDRKLNNKSPYRIRDPNYITDGSDNDAFKFERKITEMKAVDFNALPSGMNQQIN